MGTYAVTGSASGMGAEVVAKLQQQGHQVITVDIKDADVAADLSTPLGRRQAATTVLERCDGRLDGAVLAAGLGPTADKERPRLLLQVNYFGVVELLQAWRPALAATDRAKVVVFASNSTTTVPLVPRRAVRALHADDVEAALRSLRKFGKNTAAISYAASKIALAHWVRSQAVTPEWAGRDIRLNAIAPGAIMTPLLQEGLANPSEGKQIRRFPVPIGGFGDPGHLADWVVFMLSESADFVCGSVVFVDGGSDAWFRATDWPVRVPTRRLPSYLRRMKEFGRSGPRSPSR